MFDVPGVPYAVVQDLPASWHEYEGASLSVAEPPAGLILYVAGPTDEGIRIIEVWESERAWEYARPERLRSVLHALGDATGRELRFRDLHPLHLVLGSPAKTTTRAIKGRSI